MTAKRPYTLIAELTYRCPLACWYCSNPTAYGGGSALDTDQWRRILRDAEALGVVQVNLTGGEPLLRDDLEDLVREARARDLYVNLITGGIPLTRSRLSALKHAGLDAVQLSIQAASREDADRVAGIAAYDQKLAVAEWIVELGLPLTINVVLHRHNLDQVPEIITMAEGLRAHRLELANTQYLGWALENRAALLPDQGQLERARAVAEAARTRLRGTMEIVFVLPDYYAGMPRACMEGWGRRYLVVTPDGLVLPCHAAHTIPGLPLVRATEQPLQQIWEESTLFNLFRGEAWMSPTCRNCERRALDYGGCRCQAFHLTGVASATDPVCRYSEQHGLVQEARVVAGGRNQQAPRQAPRPRVLKRVP
ncbi:MAG TPA: pyrroloquinoline quinone biosynthesis protein PqqE [Nitrospira sp.]|nr:pyrroloquinoline quinone biosynthesis protein PqqE [Nitrospira sp.]